TAKRLYSQRTSGIEVQPPAPAAPAASIMVGDGESDINIADAGLEAAPHTIVNKVLEKALFEIDPYSGQSRAKFHIEKVRGRTVYIIEGKEIKNMYDLALFAMDAKDEQDLLEKLLAAGVKEITIEDVKKLKKQHGHAGIGHNQVFVLEGAIKNAKEQDGLILHEIVELDLWQIKAFELIGEKRSWLELSPVDVYMQATDVSKQNKNARIALRKWMVDNPEEAKKLAQEFHQIANKQVKFIQRANALVEERFADVAVTVGLTMGFSMDDIKDILRHTKLKLLNGSIQASAGWSGKVTLTFCDSLKDPAQAAEFFKVMAAEWGHRPHQHILNRAGTAGVHEAFDRISTLTLGVLLGRLNANDISQLAIDAFIGETFIEF
ncbi:MAG: hypothetical protein NTY47_07420, partial [Candidatus Omnitrophica bacterium]|nr:hypothetical protein [Candidatus Omnitrophota bacterium]